MLELIKTVMLGVVTAGLTSLMIGYFKLRDTVIKLTSDVSSLKENVADQKVAINDIHDIKTSLAVMTVTITEMNKKLDKYEK